MKEFHQLVHRTVTYTLYTTVLWIVLWAVLPGWRPIFSGLAIGSLASWYFAISAGRQTEITGDMAVNGQKKKPVIHWINRLLVVFAAILVSQVVSDKWGAVSVPALLIGMLLYQLILAGAYLRQTMGKK